LPDRIGRVALTTSWNFTRSMQRLEVVLYQELSQSQINAGEKRCQAIKHGCRKTVDNGF